MTANRHLWLDPSFGASGDMLLGALLGIGAPIDAVRADVAAVGVTGWSIQVETLLRAGIGATRAVVTTDEGHHHRGWSTIDALLGAAELPERVKAGARRTFRRLGEVEAAIHGIDLDAVHFHEVGAIDAIVDIVGVWSAVHHLGIVEVTAGSIGLGHGRVGAAHGLLPTPAPATADLLQGAPVHSIDVAMETTTPTGAALLATLGCWGPIPTGRLTATGRGAGGRDPESHPNVITAIVIEGEPASGAAKQPTTTTTTTAPTTTTATVLATNLDDATPEVIGHTIDRLLAAGADDAWVLPVLMKKGRPGHELRVLCPDGSVEELRTLLFTETGTLGIRAETVHKTMLPRSVRHVTVRGHRIAIKSGPHRQKPEFDDLRAAAEATGLPLAQLAREALDADS